jgi:hypothetical protein
MSIFCASEQSSHISCLYYVMKQVSAGKVNESHGLVTVKYKYIKGENSFLFMFCLPIVLPSFILWKSLLTVMRTEKTEDSWLKKVF